MTQKKHKKTWVDWMKTFGIFTIIWGHCFPKEMDSFIYAFNVPLFFWISGYLTYPETTFNRLFSPIITI